MRMVAPKIRIALALVLGLALPAGASAQSVDQECGVVRPFSEGDGRIHGSPVLQVACMDLQPGQVTTINLHPRFHTTLQFHSPVARIDAGDSDVFRAEIVGNKIMLKAIEIDIKETSMTVILGDARQTLVPFLIRADSTSPLAYVIKFDDPAVRHIADSERQIASRLSSNVDARVASLAEESVQQRLLFKSGTIEIDKRTVVGPRGERVGLIIEDAEQMPGEAGEPRLYIRYRIMNETPLPLTDAHLVSRIDSEERRYLFFGRTNSMELGHEDVRTDLTIPAGASVRGLLILDGVHLLDSQSLSIELVAFQGRRRALVERVLVGTDSSR